MKKMSRREVCVSLPALAVLGAGSPEVFAQQQKPAVASTPPTPAAGAGTLGPAHAIGYDTMAVRTMANGGESRDIAHGTLATGETVNLHQSMQVVGATPNPLHVIQHTEFILVREGELEFQHEVDGKTVTERVGPGGVFYVAFGTNHTVRNVGGVPARYFVVAIGGDAK
jgi:mannose-6-phosphate isomerase-like protein (cupin superfamily)